MTIKQDKTIVILKKKYIYKLFYMLELAGAAVLS